MMFTPRFSKSFGFQQTMFPTHQGNTRNSLPYGASDHKTLKGVLPKLLLLIAGSSLTLSGTANAAGWSPGPVAAMPIPMANTPAAPWNKGGPLNPVNYSSKNLQLAGRLNTSCKPPFRYDSISGQCRF